MSVCRVSVTCGLWAHTLFVCDPNSGKTGGLCCLAHALELPAVLCPDRLLFFWRRRLKTAKGYGQKTWVHGHGYNALVFVCFFLLFSHSCPVIHPHKHTHLIDPMCQWCSSPLSVYIAKQMGLCFIVHLQSDWFIYLPLSAPSPVCSDSKLFRSSTKVIAITICWEFFTWALSCF